MLNSLISKGGKLFVLDDDDCHCDASKLGTSFISFSGDIHIQTNTVGDAPIWFVVESDGVIRPIGSFYDIDYTRLSSGNIDVYINGTDIENRLTELMFDGSNMLANYTVTDLATQFPNLIKLSFNSNLKANLQGNLSNMNPNTTYLDLSGSNVYQLYGNLIELPSLVHLDISNAINALNGVSNIWGNGSQLSRDLEYIDLSNCESCYIFSSASDLPPVLTVLHASNTITDIGGNTSTLPTTLESIKLDNCGYTDITGDYINLPSGLTYLDLSNTGSAISGNIKDIPSGLTYLDLHGSSCTITNTITGICPARNCMLFNFKDLTSSDSDVDNVLKALYGMVSTYPGDVQTGKILDLTGANNGTPSGTYQYSATPSTGQEYAYYLVQAGWTVNIKSSVSSYTFTSTGSSLHTIQLLAVSGDTTIDWGDGSDVLYTAGEYTTITHTFVAAAAYNVTITPAPNITKLQVHTDSKISGTFTNLIADGGMANVTHLYINTTGITGDITNINALTNLLYLNISSTSITYTSGFGSLLDIRDINATDCAWVSAEIEALLQNIFDNAHSYTWSGTITMNINGTNAKPTGIVYGDDEEFPPVYEFGLQKIYYLQNYPTNLWSITYTTI